MVTTPLRLLHDGLNQPALSSSDKTAIVAEGSEYSYRELQEQSTSLADALATRGIQRGDRVAVYMDNTWPCVVSLFAIAKAGGVFLLINPQTKTDKLAYILNDSEATVLLTDGHLSSVFIAALDSCLAIKAVICSGKLSERITLKSKLTTFSAALLERPLPDNSSTNQPFIKPIIANDLCALIYTSGSTGNPKGVMHTHQSMVFTIGSLVQYLRLSSKDKILNVLPLAFDYGLYQLLMSVWLGATLVLERSFTYPAQILSRISEYQVTVFPGVPTIYALLLASHSRKPLCLPSITRVTNTAAALSPELLPAIKAIFPNALIYKMYGLTECKRVCYLEPELIDTHPSSVGRAIPGTEVYLRNEQGTRIPPGGEGILHVRGPHLMRGYWKQPELSEKMLLDTVIPGEFELCTHDWFRMDNEGLLYFLGRKDDIIKTRGEKVSPIEVENALLSIDGIHEAAVVGIPDPLLGHAIKAFISFNDGFDIPERKLKKLCLSKLENFMLPKEIVTLTTLPKSANGKIDKKRLLDNKD
ncbi:MAG: acyl--CoA ligase [Pseudomonadales bacterium]|nr:acyl--CoA ligase [Pseudomonadales bacterium]